MGFAEGDKYEVCPTCCGEGNIVHPALSVWTQEDRAEDPEGFAHMMEGKYDITCPECQGKRVVTQEDMQQYSEQTEDHFTRLKEQGIYPGNRDYF